MKGKPTLWTDIKTYKFNSIFIKTFIVVFFLLMVPLVCLHYLVFIYNDSSMREEISRASLNELTRIRDNVDLIMAEAESLSIRLGNDPDIEVFLKEDLFDYPLDYSTISRIRRIQHILGISILTNPYVETIQLYSGSGKNDYLLSETSGGTLDKFDHQWWYDEFSTRRDGRNFWIRSLPKPVRDTFEHYLVLFRKLPVTGSKQEGG
ncbi:hypothetical protein N6H14_27170 [Paenibacillus sp. CC-CFT747]|nr:hypothetical protein N6H14_27170 [Paenibacillus sp. CC-CFT747]